MPKQSSFCTERGCLLKGLGLFPRSLREGRIPPLGPEMVGVAEVGPIEGVVMPGCHGEGIELPTSLPASEAEKRKLYMKQFDL